MTGAGDSGDRTGERRPIRTLLADNHTMFRQALARMLSRGGEVEVVGDADHGPQAVELARKTKPDLVIMQVESLPEKAASEIRGILDASPDSRVIVLSIHQDPSMVRKGMGASAYVHKNSTVEELLQMVRYAAEGSPMHETDRGVLGMPRRMIRSSHARGSGRGPRVDQEDVRRDQQGHGHHGHDPKRQDRALEGGEVVRGLKRPDHAEDPEEVVEGYGAVYVPRDEEERARHQPDHAQEHDRGHRVKRRAVAEVVDAEEHARDDRGEDHGDPSAPILQ